MTTAFFLFSMQSLASERIQKLTGHRLGLLKEGSNPGLWSPEQQRRREEGLVLNTVPEKVAGGVFPWQRLGSALYPVHSAD